MNMDYIPPNNRIDDSDVQSLFLKRKDSFKWFAFSMVGIIIIFVGSLWVTYAAWTPAPKASSYQNNQEYAKALNDWKNATETGNLYGRITIEVGAMIIITGSFLGYIDPAVDETDKRRLLIMIFLALIILIVVSVGLVEQSPYGPI